ncbi:MAG: AAA family ATPase [Lachnospiraceae bacterium]|nr:AAA family ATPase [Lachnospiraceae bacterium]
MYEAFFEMENTPFTRDIPADRLYRSSRINDAVGRLMYVADKRKFAVVTAEPGCGKSTLIRLLKHDLPKDKYMVLYISDSKLTPRWLYAGLLDQMGLESHFYRGDSKRKLQKEIEDIRTEQKKKVICVLDEAHLLDKETLEEFRFLLNSQFDSESPMSLVLVGQPELWEQKLRLQKYAAIRQRIDMNIVLEKLDRAETSKYIAAHLAYAGCNGRELFTSGADDEIYKISAGIPRMINRVCENSLMYAYQQQKRLIDEHMVRFVADHEMLLVYD